MFGQGQLQKDAVHVVTAVELGDEGQQGLLRGIGRQTVGEGKDARLGAGTFLVAHVDL